MSRRWRCFGGPALGLQRRPALVLVLSALLVTVLPGCNPAQPSDAATSTENGNVAAPTAQRGKEHMLSIYGYNYTNRYIDQLYVDGQGGGNLDVSKPSAGGGKDACCIIWRDGTPLPQTVRVKWVSGGCMWHGRNSYGEASERVRHYFTESDVQLAAPVPAQPRYFEVHIYPGERIEVAITEKASSPRLKLNPNRSVDPYPTRCKDQQQ